MVDCEVIYSASSPQKADETVKIRRSRGVTTPSRQRPMRWRNRENEEIMNRKLSGAVAELPILAATAFADFLDFFPFEFVPLDRLIQNKTSYKQ